MYALTTGGRHDAKSTSEAHAAERHPGTSATSEVGTNPRCREFSLEHYEDAMSDDPTADSSKIVLLEEHENRYWTKHLGVTREEIQRAVEQIGHSDQTSKKPITSR